MSVKIVTATVPSIAVLVSGTTLSNLRKQVVNPRIELLVKANKQVNLNLYYFSMSGVRLKERLIDGLYWNELKRTWVPDEFAFPDVLYLRGGISEKYSVIFNSFREILKSSNAKIINYPRFNKWDLYRIIKNDPVLKSYLPVTITVNKPQNIAQMLQEYKIIYLKPHNGRKGKDVLRVEDLSDGRYFYSYYKEGQLNGYYKNNQVKPVLNTVYGFQLLLERIYKIFQGKRFLAQQAIKLIKSGNKLVDLRAELQRNGHGVLEIVGISARLGQSYSPITTHGNAYRIEHFLKNVLLYPNERVGEIQENVNEFLFRIYNCIEKTYGEYVEIGIDFAVDNNDKIWLIEANSQSTKVSLGKAYGHEVLMRAYKNILEYARYVSMKR